MTYYHASPAGGLQVLELRKSPYFDKPTQVCLTSLRAMALFYLIRNYEYAYGYTRQGKLYFDEPFPDALKKLYAGKSGWLYTCEEGNYEKRKFRTSSFHRSPSAFLTRNISRTPMKRSCTSRRRAISCCWITRISHLTRKNLQRSAPGWKKPFPKRFGRKQSGKPRIPTARVIIGRTIRKSGNIRWRK